MSEDPQQNSELKMGKENISESEEGRVFIHFLSY